MREREHKMLFTSSDAVLERITNLITVYRSGTFSCLIPFPSPTTPGMYSRGIQF